MYNLINTTKLCKELEMQEHYTTKGKHLTYQERKLIYKWHNEKKSNREIARLLGKSPQTINNEIKRGKVKQKIRKDTYSYIYHFDFAQNRYLKKRLKSVKKTMLTKELINDINHYNKNKISPEMMVKRYNVKASISTIYYWIHTGKLPKNVKLLYSRKKKKQKVIHTKGINTIGKSIEERPEYINNRLCYGHYEIDTVILAKEKSPCLLTMVDRKSRQTIIRLISSKSSLDVNKALSDILKKYEVKSITSDNGREFARLSDVFNKNHIYYAHPYSSWERGTNENHNRLIRRWLPKGTKKTTHEEVVFIEHWINSYPKKILNYMTPREISLGG